MRQAWPEEFASERLINYRRHLEGTSTMSINRRIALGLSAAALALGMAGSATLAQTAPEVTLRMHHFLSAQGNVPKSFLEPWARKVEAESKGKIKVDVYPSMQLGGKPPQLYDQAKDGIVDIVWTLSGNTPGRFPKLEVFELPWMPSAKGEITSQALWEFWQTHAKDEAKDVKVLAIFAHAKGNFYTKDKQVVTPADVKGLKIRVPTRTINDTLVLMGASPQGIPAPGVPEALAKGVVDGVMMPFEVVPALKIHELTNKASTFAGDRGLYTAVFFLAMNQAKYDGLSAELKKVIDDNAGMATSKWAGKVFDESDKIGLEALASVKTEVKVIDGADLAAWKAATKPINEAWVAARDKEGAKGAELLKAADDLIVKYSK
jgi:TRAP-type transport system periplasmic protein